MIRILHVLHDMNPGGMEGRVARLARGLDPDRFAVHIVTLRKPNGAQVPLPAHVPRTLHEIPSGIHPGRLLALAAAVRRGAYDVVHTHNWSSMFYGMLAGWLGRAPLLFHGEHGLDEVSSIPSKRLMAQRALASLADRVVSVNASIAANVRKTWGVPDRKVVVLPNGVDIERFRPAEAGPPSVFTVGTVGRLDPVKNYGCLVDAFRIFLDRIAPEPARLIFVGEGGLARELADRCRDLGIADSVQFAGGSDRTEEWYGRFSAYVNCSIYEGMSNTVLESMAAGLPVVVSDVPGHRDWIREEENALFFPSGDAAALADRLAALHSARDKARAMGERNRARALKEFDNRDFIRRYADLYMECLDTRRLR